MTRLFISQVDSTARGPGVKEEPGRVNYNKVLRVPVKQALNPVAVTSGAALRAPHTTILTARQRLEIYGDYWTDFRSRGLLYMNGSSLASEKLLYLCTRQYTWKNSLKLF